MRLPRNVSRQPEGAAPESHQEVLHCKQKVLCFDKHTHQKHKLFLPYLEHSRKSFCFCLGKKCAQTTEKRTTYGTRKRTKATKSMQGRAQVPGMTPLTLLPTLLYWPTPAVEPPVGSGAAPALSRHSGACTLRLSSGAGSIPSVTRDPVNRSSCVSVPKPSAEQRGVSRFERELVKAP